MGSSRDQREESKYLAIFFMAVGLLFIIFYITKKEFNLFKIAILAFFIIIGFLLFKFRNEIEDFRKSQREKYYKKDK